MSELDIDLLNEACNSLSDLIDLLMWDSSPVLSIKDAKQRISVLKERHDRCGVLQVENSLGQTANTTNLYN